MEKLKSMPRNKQKPIPIPINSSFIITQFLIPMQAPANLYSRTGLQSRDQAGSVYGKAKDLGKQCNKKEDDDPEESLSNEILGAVQIHIQFPANQVIVDHPVQKPNKSTHQ
jgi:hypothetical protein